MARPRPCWLPNTVAILRVCFSTGNLSPMVFTRLPSHTHLCLLCLSGGFLSLHIAGDTGHEDVSKYMYVYMHTCVHAHIQKNMWSL